MMRHTDARELIEPYLFGELDDAERKELERHLAEGCTECLTRVRELSETSAHLAMTVSQVTPSPRVRERIMTAAQGDHVSLITRERATSVIPWMVVISSVAAVIAFAIWNANLQRENAKLLENLAAYEDATLLLGQPGMQFVDLAGVDPNPQAFGKVVVDPQRGTGVVYMYRLPKTPAGMAYQLWVMRDGRPTSAGQFTVADDGSAVLSLKSLDSPSALASFQVTIEPASGADAPTGMMYLTGPSAAP